MFSWVVGVPYSFLYFTLLVSVIHSLCIRARGWGEPTLTGCVYLVEFDGRPMEGMDDTYVGCYLSMKL